MRVGQNAPFSRVCVPLPSLSHVFQNETPLRGSLAHAYNKGSMMQAKGLSHPETGCLTLGHVGEGPL